MAGTRTDSSFWCFSNNKGWRRVACAFKYLAGNSRKPWNTDGTAQALAASCHDSAVVIVK